MAVTSTMLPLGTQLPTFDLPDVRTGGRVSSARFAGSPLLVMFICNHCPYVQLIREGLASLGRDYRERSLGIVAISANDPTVHSDDAPEELARVADQAGYEFGVLYDESQDVARAFNAACTPDFFLFDSDHRLVYRGQFDDARPQNGLPVTGESLREAIEALLAGKPIPEEQRPSMGCSIKWKAEPLS